MKLNKMALGLTAGIFWGLAIFLTTNFRLLTGGTGEALSKLDVLYFGYSFSFLGSLIGLLWGFVYGFITGWLFALLYNLLSRRS